MHFKEEHLPSFFKMFENVKQKIRNQPGCIDLEMLQDRNSKGMVFTYSHWESEDDLNAYRHTEMFGVVWKETKSYFEGKPEAWTLKSLYKLPA
jgi:heme-degrading monooxygenase HmoA